MNLRNLDHKINQAGQVGIALGDNSDYAAFTGFDLLNVRDHLFVGTIFGGNYHDGHILVNEGDGAVFHLGSGVALGVDVADFFEFQGSFERDGEIHAPP